MADLTITAANVVAGANASTEKGTADETITAGQVVYLDTATRKYLKADSNSATDAANRARGIALNSASLNQPLTVQKTGDITIGATLTPGEPYYLSDTAGGICPKEDVGSGEEISFLGLAKSASVLTIDIQSPGVTL